MKKLTSLVVAVLMMIPGVALPALVYAEEAATTTSTTSTETEAETETEKKERTTRLEAYKKAYTQRLTEAVKTRVAARCVAAQALVNAHSKRSSGFIKSRSIVYDNLVKRLEKTMTNVGSEGTNNLALETNIVELKTMIAEFKTAAETFEQSLADVAAMDCKADPTAFKAALETARSNQQVALKAAQVIRTYLTDTVKPTLVALKEAKINANNSTE